MKVKELIEELKNCEPEKEVFIDTKTNPSSLEIIEGTQIQLEGFVIFSKE